MFCLVECRKSAECTAVVYSQRVKTCHLFNHLTTVSGHQAAENGSVLAYKKYLFY